MAVIHPNKATHDNSYNLQMLKGGHAHCYMLSGPQTAQYKAAEAEAKSKKQGMWKNRKIEEPRHFRKREKQRAERKARVRAVLILGAAIVTIGIAIVTNYERFTG